jgi:hypothetical protein
VVVVVVVLSFLLQATTRATQETATAAVVTYLENLDWNIITVFGFYEFMTNRIVKGLIPC